MCATTKNKTVLVRDPEPPDEDAWRALWAGYTDFYETNVAEPVTAGTWRRLLTPNAGLFGRVAELHGNVVGFTVCVLHAGSWTLHPICYLEDLFVAPEARGLGVGRALIDDLLLLAGEKGWSRLYWHTRAGNETARRLYDRFTAADDFVRYRIPLA